MLDKEKTIISVTNYARKRLGLDKHFWVLISDINHFKSKDHSGLYDKERFLIRFNKSWIKEASIESLLKCSFHEVFHAFQHQEILKSTIGLKSDFFSMNELKIMKKEFEDENYNLEMWPTYLIEEQAEVFALLLYSEIKKEYDDMNKIVDKYYTMFPNIE